MKTELIEKVARAIVAELRDYCTGWDGACYAHCDDGPAPDGGWFAEVNGEFSTYALATAAITAMQSEIEQPGWQPIERAPNDVVIVTDGGYVMSACQNGGRWFTGWQCGDVHIRVDLEPTHWMPLPAPPAIEAGEHRSEL